MHKKILAGALVFLALTGCHSEQVEANKTPPPGINPVAAENVSDKEAVEEDLIEDFKYLDNHISDMTEKEATDWFYKLEEMSIKKQFYYIEVISLDKHIQTELMKCYDATKGEFDFGKYDGGSGMIIEEIYASGYKLVPYEGVIYPVTDYSKFKPYAAFMSDEVQSYIYIKALESEEITSTRSTLEISQADLVERILMAENHIRKFKDGKTYPIVLEMYKAYMYYYIPSVIAYEDSIKLNEETVSEYKSFIDAHPDTIAAKVVSDYLETLSDNHYEKNDAMKAYLSGFYDSLDGYISKTN